MRQGGLQEFECSLGFRERPTEIEDGAVANLNVHVESMSRSIDEGLNLLGPNSGRRTSK